MNTINDSFKVCIQILEIEVNCFCSNLLSALCEKTIVQLITDFTD